MFLHLIKKDKSGLLETIPMVNAEEENMEDKQAPLFIKPMLSLQLKFSSVRKL